MGLKGQGATPGPWLAALSTPLLSPGAAPQGHRRPGDLMWPTLPPFWRRLHPKPFDPSGWGLPGGLADVKVRAQLGPFPGPSQRLRHQAGPACLGGSCCSSPGVRARLKLGAMLQPPPEAQVGGTGLQSLLRGTLQAQVRQFACSCKCRPRRKRSSGPSLPTMVPMKMSPSGTATLPLEKKLVTTNNSLAQSRAQGAWTVCSSRTLKQVSQTTCFTSSLGNLPSPPHTHSASRTAQVHLLIRSGGGGKHFLTLAGPGRAFEQRDLASIFHQP